MTTSLFYVFPHTHTRRVPRYNHVALWDAKEYVLAERFFTHLTESLDPTDAARLGQMALDLGDPDQARAVATRTRVFQLAESLGGVHSLVSIPALQTHASVPRELREAMGITEGLVRLSVGIEDLEDLLEDLGQALA